MFPLNDFVSTAESTTGSSGTLCGLSERDHAVDNPLAIRSADSEQQFVADGQSTPQRNCQESRVPFRSVWGDPRLMIVEPCYFSFV